MSKTINVTQLELQNILGAGLREVLRTDLTPEEREILNEKSRLILQFANNQINNANSLRENEKLLAQSGELDKSVIKAIVGTLEEME